MLSEVCSEVFMSWLVGVFDEFMNTILINVTAGDDTQTETGGDHVLHVDPRR